MSFKLRCVNCRRPIFVNKADGVAYHESTGERPCGDHSGAPLARAPITPTSSEES